MNPHDRCVARANARLSEANTVLELVITRDRRYPILHTSKINRKLRGKAFLLVPTYCPFCGEKYDERAGFSEGEALARAVEDTSGRTYPDVETALAAFRAKHPRREP